MIEPATEARAAIRTKMQDPSAAIRELHSYELPEILAFDAAFRSFAQHECCA